ncbi:MULTISPECIES: RDD family protein [unclassified Lysobacter]|uniref:RDD family protein n=1 Tax=unclassified Lysobacter TaxID=2635362 RepID=UPI001C21AB57|nr:RDD family protein [Lysobacter sp. MMG2]MBU8977015.1 RDD family protein [Lysobacter sp. MMG2]
MSEMDHNPYSAPTADLSVDAALVSSPARKAERSTRLIASLIDGLLAMVAWVPLFIGVTLAEGDKRVVGIVLIVIGFLALLALLVFQLTLLSRHGQTWGKRQQGIRIVRSSGEPIGVGRILGLRIVVPAVIGAIPFVGGLFSLANILWIFGEERRCLHDHIADTIVVNV